MYNPLVVPQHGNIISYNPVTKDDWRALLQVLYHYHRKAHLPVYLYPPMYAKGALRLDGVIGGKTIGKIAI